MSGRWLACEVVEANIRNAGLARGRVRRTTLKHYSKTAAVLVIAVITAVPALSQNSRVFREGSAWVEEITGTLPQTRNLKVTTDLGSVQVTGGNESEIKYVIRKRSYTYSEQSARNNFQQFHVNATRRGDVAILEGSWDGGHARKFNAEFVVTVPRDTNLVKLNTDGGSMSVRSLSGRIEAETGGGSVRLDDLSGSVTAETGGGTIDVGNTTGELALTTGGGSIRVAASKGRVVANSGGGTISVGSAASVLAETGGGSVDVGNCAGETKVNTGGGMISLGEINGPVSMETGGGSIRLASARGPVKVSTGGGTLELWKLWQGVRAETGAGSITAELVGTPNGVSTLETSAGDLIVYISPEVKVNVDAAIETAMGHKITSDFSELQMTSQGGDWGPKEMFAKGSLNGGGPLLKLRTTIGNIMIHRAKR
jgi:hypothetical protein